VLLRLAYLGMTSLFALLRLLAARPWPSVGLTSGEGRPLHRLIIRNIRDEYGLRSREQRPARLTQC
jgi:hypothetical protein